MPMNSATLYWVRRISTFLFATNEASPGGEAGNRIDVTQECARIEADRQPMNRSAT